MTVSKKRIGIGTEADPEMVIANACRVNIPYDIVCYCRPGTASVPPGNSRVKLAESADPGAALVADLMAGTIQAAVRGDLRGEVTLKVLEAAAGVSRLERVALLETANGKKFMFAPDGIAGNFIFRTLEYLGAGYGHGALVVNIDKIFIDTSHAHKSYTNALILAASLLDD